MTVVNHVGINKVATLHTVTKKKKPSHLLFKANCD